MSRADSKKTNRSPTPVPRPMAYQTPSILLPSADRIPEARRGRTHSSPGASVGVLPDFLRHSQPWSEEPVPLSLGIRRTLWALVPVEVLWGIWLLTVVTGAARCDGPICSVATLDRHAAVLLVFAVLCLTGLVGLAPATRGLAQCNGREVAGLGVAAVAGGASLLGIAALLLGAVIVLMILAAFCAALSATA